MKNLAQHPHATLIFLGELIYCGVKAVSSPEPDPETRARLDGQVELGSGYRLRLVRRWSYVSARITPPLPVEGALVVNETPWGSSVLGATARAEGYSGGVGAEFMRRHLGQGVSYWHVGGIPALRVLIRVLRRVVRSP